MLAALAAGFLSFLSPCVLPLVPAYLASVAGASVLTSDRPQRRFVLLHTIAFILGFSLVFAALGASLGLLGGLVPLELLRCVAGGLLIALGIFLAAATRVSWLNYERRLSLNNVRSTGYLRSLLVGASFALGWTPCIGPILGGILTLAWSSQALWRGIYLLLAYCLGLGLPFLLVGLVLEAAWPYLKWLRRHAFLTSLIAAALLIVLGILILTGYLEYLGGLVSGGYRYAP